MQTPRFGVCRRDAKAVFENTEGMKWSADMIEVCMHADADT